MRNAGDQANRCASWSRDMDAGHVDTLLILGGNPVYAAPADLGFGDALARLR